MQYGNSSDSGRYTSFSSTSATASFSPLRERSLPPLVAAPRFGVPQTPEWLAKTQRFIGRYAFAIAMLAAIAAVALAAVPAWAALQPQGPGSRLGTVSSSAGVTGTASTRVADLSTETFIGGLPFVQQSRVIGEATGSFSAPARFVAAIPQASLHDYIGSVGNQVALPYLSNAALLKSNVESWTAAVQQQQAALAASAPYVAAFQAPSIAPGTVVHNARATFYTCAGGGFCGAMANGQQVFDGAAACSYDMSFGTRFFLNNDPTRRVYTCLDRGAISSPWVDIWFYNPADGWAWQAMIGGTYSDITIVE